MTRWIPAVRVFLVTLAAQPAVAALIHDTAIRYPVIGAVISAAVAVEAAILTKS